VEHVDISVAYSRPINERSERDGVPVFGTIYPSRLLTQPLEGRCKLRFFRHLIFLLPD